MFKCPSSRRKSSKEPININLVPMLDALVTLIAFLMFTMSFLAVVNIESPAPIASSENIEAEMKEKPLQLTLSIDEKKSRIWSPFERISAVDVSHLTDGAPDTVGIHKALLQVKAQFPAEQKIVLVPAGATTYDVLVAVMDSVRMLEKTDPPVFATNKKTGVDEQVTTLFPQVIFGNLLGDT